ncbi:hypothetical protein CARUB_v10024413mg [Capsella rubella]|uniref:Uncharacterized protein n=1 Tax=Capsella rubella TaxID=81985 RepID=R0HVU3_9BRAS|nr:uncharacterized protein LOC17890050 [Capsella rubella]EOA28223.1 hypothetical protein CARUB_v10024413mg [Capsella rubella]
MEAEKTPPTTTTTPATTTTEKKTGPEVKDNDLPTNSPYMATGTLEDYKMKAYGAEGHQEPTPGLGGGSTDAPTPSGDAPAAATTTTGAKAP